MSLYETHVYLEVPEWFARVLEDTVIKDEIEHLVTNDDNTISPEEVERRIRDLFEIWRKLRYDLGHDNYLMDEKLRRYIEALREWEEEHA